MHAQPLDPRVSGAVLLALVATAVGSGCSFDLSDVTSSPTECPTGRARCESGNTAACETDILSSPDHCGACDHSCLGGGCTDGRCEAKALGVSTGKPYGVALDSKFVYFVDNGGGTVNKIDKSGDPNTLVVLASDQTGASFVAVDPGTDGAVYFTRDATGGGVSKVDKEGESVAVLAEVDSSWEIAIDEKYVYFSSANGLHRVAKTGDSSSLKTLAPLTSNPGSVAIDAESIYFNDKAAGTVNRLPKDGSSEDPEVLAELQPMPDGIALDQENVYWTCFSGDTVARRSKEDADDRTALAMGQLQPNGITAVGAFVYYTTYSGGTLSRVSVSGGEPLLLAKCDSPLRVAVDDSYAYFTASGQTSSAPGIFKVPK